MEMNTTKNLKKVSFKEPLIQYYDPPEPKVFVSLKKTNWRYVVLALQAYMMISK